MKKRLLMCLAAALLCTLLCVSVFAAASTGTSTLATNADPSADCTEGQDIDVFILISPFAKVSGSGANIKSVARLDGDPTENNKALTLGKVITDLKYSVSYSTDDFVYLGASYASAPSKANDAAQTTGDATYPLYAFYGAGYNGVNVFTPSVSHDAVTGTVTLDFGSSAAGGFGINHSATPTSAVVAKLTFRVKSGAVGGDSVPFDMTMDYRSAERRTHR